MSEKWPSIFVGHGAPTLALSADKGAPLSELAAAVPRPRAVLVVSAHWEAAPVAVGSVTTLPLIYDFAGFPQALREVRYPAPGAPQLAERVDALLGGVRRLSERGLDHGVWTPLVHMFPQADVPVLQLSLPRQHGSAGVWKLGEQLRPLRDEGVLILASGNITHNLRTLRPDGSAPEAAYAEFDAWARERLMTKDFDALVNAPERAPAFALNHPRDEHWLPLLIAAAASAPADDVSFPVEGWEYGNLSRRAVRFG